MVEHYVRTLIQILWGKLRKSPPSRAVLANKTLYWWESTIWNHLPHALTKYWNVAITMKKLNFKSVFNLNLKRRGFDPWVRKIPWRRAWQPFPVFLAWRIPQTEEPGGLQSMGSQRVRYDWGNFAHTHCHFRAEDSHLVVCHKTRLWGP